ncbi:dna recombination and repair protein reco [hydrocarbon metagenome]|uniref:DNA repair protein RecO n=1 Tax=hydrocarbon metagenome TaxID=938273 RepID=A0A0W8E6T1_9ZZZZ
MYYQSRSIILRTSDLREADKIVSLFSEQEGKISAVARGVKKPKSSLRVCVQPFCHSLLYFSSGRELDLITQGKLIEFYGNTREDMQRMLYAVYIMELLDKSLMERMPLRELYIHTLQVLEYMNQWGINPLIIRSFELKLLMCLGYTPLLDHCINCGSPRVTAFDMPEGSAICDECQNKSSSAYPLSAPTLALLRLLLGANTKTISRVKASNQSLIQLENFLEAYLEYHLERKFNLKRTIRTLKDRMML